MSDKLSIDYLKKHGTAKQLKGLKNLGNSDYNAKTDKLKKSYDPKKIEGDLEAFKKSELKQVFNEKELEEVFKIIDADGDGKISAAEAKNLAKLGTDTKDDKIDNSDIKTLFKNAQKYVDENTKVKTNKDGSRTVTTTDENGTTTTIKYDKDGKKTSKVVTEKDGTESTTNYSYDKNGKLKKAVTEKTEIINGQKTTVSKTTTKYEDGKKVSKVTENSDGTKETTKYKYDKDGNLTSTETKSKVKVNGKYETATTSETTYKDGKKHQTVTYDAKGNKLSTTTYNYNAAGELTTASKKNADGTTQITEYDPSTGKRISKETRNKDGQILSSTKYDKKTGKATSKTVNVYDENGQRTSSKSYTYDKNGKLKTRDVFEIKDGKYTQVSTSTYTHNADGTMTRTDKDMSGNVIAKTNFTYDSRGETIKSVTTDKDGKVTKTVENEYYNSGVQRSKTTTKYASDGSYTKTIVSYSESGEKTGTRVEKYDKDGNIISLTEKTD